MHRTRRHRRWIAGVIGLGLLITGCETDDRTPTNSGVGQAGLEDDGDVSPRTDDRSAVPSATRSATSVSLARDDVAPRPGVERAATTYTTQLLASQIDLTDRSGNWEGLWTLLADAGVQDDAIPLEVAPFWILAAANTDRLSGCTDDWAAFMRDVVSEFEVRYPEGHPSDEFVDEALATLLLWIFDYTNDEATSAAAEQACEQ